MLEVSVLRPRSFSAPFPGRSLGWGRGGGLFIRGLHGSGKKEVFQAPLEHCPGNIC